MTQVAIDTLDLSVSVASQPFGSISCLLQLLQLRAAGRRQADGMLSASNTELLI